MTSATAHPIPPLERWLTIVLAAFLFWLVVAAWRDPIAAASGFGMPLANAADHFYLYVKGDRDLGCALAVTALLWLRERRALGVLVLAATVEPISDAVIVCLHPSGQLGQALMVHGSAAVYCILLAWRLLRR